LVIGTSTAQARPSFHASGRAAPQYAVRTNLSWLVGGMALSFVVPFVFTSLLHLNHDLYYLLYFSIALLFLAAYIARAGVDLVNLFRRNWQWSVAFALPASAFLIMNVLSRDGTDGPSGFYAGFEIVWRGLVYGIVDALLLTVFPCVVALALMNQDIRGAVRRLSWIGLALPMILIITGVYHLGYEQFREDGIGGPEIGNTVISLPMLATANPFGSIIAHASMHITADIYSYETDVFLPPQTEAPDR
jgi:hypothetical protein